METNKIFLSTSKSGDYDLFLKVKSSLTKEGYEVITYSGGQYSPEPMLSCDYLLMIPPINEMISNDQRLIGKGQYSEIVTWQRLKSGNVIIVTEEEGDTRLSSLLKQSVYDENNWKTGYGIITLGRSFVFSGIIKDTPKKSSDSTIMLACIKKLRR